MGLSQADLEKVGRMLSDRYGIRVVCVGTRCATDGKTIFLPYLPNIDDNPKLLSLVRYYLDHECGHIVGESDMTVLDEVHKEGEDAVRILDALEDCRVEQIMSDIWVGCGVNLRVGLRELLARMPANDDPMFQITIALFLTAKGINPPDWVDDRMLAIARDEGDALQEIPLWASKTRDLLPMMRRVLDKFRALFQNEQSQQPQDQQGQADDQQSQQSQPATDGEGQSGEDGAEGDGSGRQRPDASTGVDAEDQPAEAEASGGDDAGESDDASENSGRDDEKSLTGGTEPPKGDGLPPEPPNWQDAFDVKSEIADAVEAEAGNVSGLLNSPVSPELDKILPHKTLCRDKSKVDAFKRSALAAGGPMKQKLSQLLMSEARTWWRGGLKRGLPDARTLAALATGLDDRVMRRRREHKAPNTACHLLIDGSSSMTTTEMDESFVAAAAFASVLESSGHKSCVSVFVNGDCAASLDDCVTMTDGQRKAFYDSAREAVKRGARTHGVNLWVYKGWSETTATAFKKMACGRHGRGGTPMGPAISAAAKDLAVRPERRKLIMVFTDGAPDSAPAVASAIRQCERCGIEIVLIGICGASCVERLHTRHAVVYDMKGLAKTTIKELAIALRPSKVS